jgi:Ca2+/Na+ antiporter
MDMCKCIDNLKNFTLPDSTKPLEDQIIPLTRNILIILWFIFYIILGLKDVNYTFLTTSVLVILIMYYIKYYYIYKQRNNMIENYCPMSNRQTKLEYCENKSKTFFNTDTQTIPLSQWDKLPKGNNLRIENPSKYMFCNNDVYTGENQRYYSTNQALVGNANPKTLAPTPVIAPPAAWDYWSEDFVIPKGINDKTNFDLLGSGYVSLSKCNDFDVPLPERRQQQTFPYQEKVPQGFYSTPQNDTIYNRVDTVEGFNTLYPGPNLQQSPEVQHKWINEKGTRGDIIGCTYNPQQMLNHNIPSNVLAGECSRDNVYNTFNKNLFTNIMQPGMYSRSEVVEPIQSNMGISVQQQIQPVTCEKSENGGITYVTHDPRIILPYKSIPAPPVEPNNSNVYDPRTHGYGTSYRSYTDTMLGQTRFMYDDIDVIRKPNYIIRSNIDDASWAQSYGPMKQNDNELNMHSRHMAQNKFFEDSSKQRQELQERAMHKYNTQVGWQRRTAPIQTMGGKMNTCRR